MVGVIAYFVYKFINAGNEGVKKISAAADVAATKAGYVTSDGQTDPILRYNQAKKAYADAHGYTSTSGIDVPPPPGFPTYDTWKSTNAADTPSWGSAWVDAFETAL